mgnify:CR=1 FL=1
MEAELRTWLFTLSFLIFINGEAGISPSYSAQIFQQGGEETQPLFRLEGTTEKAGATEIQRSIIRAAQGDADIVHSEELTLLNNEFKKFIIQHRQLQEKWTVELEDGRYKFTTENVITKKVKTSDESYSSNFVVGPMVYARIVKEWEKLNGGESVEVKVGALSRRETIGFYLAKDGERLSKGERIARILLRPKSILIAAFLDPIEFHIRMRDKKLLSTVGRTQLRILRNGSWQDLIALTNYEN